jgi:hypothetical protein
MTMTEQQREVYLLLCMSGRNGEAEQYKAKCEIACMDETELAAKDEDENAG